MSRRAEESQRVVGIDGARGGWVAATVGPAPDSGSEVAFDAEIAGLLDRCRSDGVAAVGVDMPIGYAADGRREAERLARLRLGRRACTLFPMPAHAVLDADDWSDALALNRELAGRGLSKQAFHLLGASREVRAALSPDEQPWCSEIHPESSFTAMNGGTTLPPKGTVEGRRQRLALVVALVADDASVHIMDSGVPVVDALDAYAAAWTARRVARGAADVLGGGTDPDGYTLTITV